MLGQRKWAKDGHTRRTPYMNRRMSWVKSTPSYWPINTFTRNVFEFRLNRTFREL